MTAFIEELIAHAEYPVQDATISALVCTLPPTESALIDTLGPRARKWWAYHRHQSE